MQYRKLLAARILIWMSVLLAGTGCAWAQTPSYRKLADIAYAKDDESQVMDAYIPSSYENARVILYIHGGGWTGGDKKELPASVIDELVGRKKYILVSMNYRLVHDGKNRFPAQIEDVASALAFLSRYAGRYNYNGKEFALMGGSAGAHLAMLYAYGYDKDRQVKTVVDFWGPTDLSDKAVRSENKDADAKVVNLLGVSDPQARVCQDASPYYRLTASTGVPTILFHGEEDPLVSISQAEKLYQKLQDLHIPAQFRRYPHAKHGVDGADAADVFARTEAWLDQYYPASGVAGAGAGGVAAAGGMSTANVQADTADHRTYAEMLGWPKGSKVIIFHVDDAGMSLNSNEGAINSIEKGVATSTSIMMPCPWAASFAKYAIAHNLDAGLHLTLTSEWKDYRWPPLSGAKQAGGLTDKEWCLWPEVEDVVAHASADEVEAEIRAQLARALSLGLHPTHLDSHMGTLFASPAYMERYIKVGIEQGIPVMFPGGNDQLLIEGLNAPVIKQMKVAGKWKEGTVLPLPEIVTRARPVGRMIWKAGLPVLDDLLTFSGDWKPEAAPGKPIDPRAYGRYKTRQFIAAIERMQPGVAMFIVHSSVLTDDFRHITGSGESRNADMLCMMDPELKAYIQSKGIILTTWRELLQRRKQVP